MAKKEQSLEEYMNSEPKADRKYSFSELKKFNEMVQKYYFNYVLVRGKDKGQTIRVLDKQKLMIDYGVISSTGAILLSNIQRKNDDQNNSIKSYDKPTRLAEFENLLNQWQWWKVNTGLDEVRGDKKMEQLDELAQQMTLERYPDTVPFGKDYEIPF